MIHRPTITKDQYLTLKAMAIACSKDYTIRVVLTNLYYNNEKKQFVCTDGHIMRMEKMELEGVNSNFYINPKSLFHTKTTLKAVPGDEIEIEGLETDNMEIYPQYQNVIPEKFEAELNSIGLDLDLLVRLRKSYNIKNVNMNFKFSKKLGAIGIYSRITDTNDLDEEMVLSGIVMPIRIKTDESFSNC